MITLVFTLGIVRCSQHVVNFLWQQTGIGRVAIAVLCKFFDTVDICEPCGAHHLVAFSTCSSVVCGVLWYGVAVLWCGVAVCGVVWCGVV